MKKVLLLLCFIWLIAFGFSYAQTQEIKNNDLVNQGIKLFSQEKWSESLEVFTRALEADPQNSLVLLYLLHLGRKQGNILGSIDVFQKKVLNNPDQLVYRAQLGIAYFSQGLYDRSRLEDALEELKQVAQSDPNLALSYTGMGLVYYMKRVMPRAKGFFLKAVSLNPQDIIALEKLGEILLIDEKQPSEALKVFDKIVQLLPEYPDGHFYLGSAYESLGEEASAIKEFEQCLQLDPKGVLQGYWAPRRIADIYLARGEKPRALEYFKKALQIAPESSYLKDKIKKLEAEIKAEQEKKLSPKTP